MADNVTKTITIKINGEDALVDLNEIKKAVKDTTNETEKLKDTKFSNFSGQLSDLVSQFRAGEIGVKGLAQGVITLGKAMFTAFITNPVLLAIGAITVAVVALYNIFKDFKPLIDKVEQAFAGLSAIFTTLKTTAIGLLTGTKSLKESFTGLGTAMKDAAIEAANLEKAQQDLEDSQASLNVQNAETQTQIQQLILQSKNRTLSEEERIKLIDKALVIEKEQHEKNIKYADEAERIALRKMLVGQRLSDQEIENIRKGGIEALRNLQNQKDIADEDIENYAGLLEKKQSLLQGSIALTEKSENQKAALEDKRIAAREAAAAKAAAEKEKRDAEEKARIDKQVQDRIAAENAADEALNELNTNQYERQKAAEQFEVDRIKDDEDRTNKRIELNKKQLDSDIELQESIINNSDSTTEQILNAINTIDGLQSEYYIKQATLDDDLAKIKLDNAKKVEDEQKKLALERFDTLSASIENQITKETMQLDEKLFLLRMESDAIKKANVDNLISDEEATARMINNRINLQKVKDDARDKTLEDAKQLVDTLSAIDQAATETAINNQKLKLQNGKITQEQYDKNVAEIQEKAAKREKAYAVSAAIINTAQGITQALASSPPPMSFILAAAIGALGAAQIAKILTTPTKADSGAGQTAITAPNTTGGESTNTAPNTSFSFSPVAEPVSTAVVKTYVLGKDVATQAQLDRQVVVNGVI